MQPDAFSVGDCLREVIARIAIALMEGDIDEAWAAVVSVEATEACSAWDRFRGGYASSEEELVEIREDVSALQEVALGD